MSRRDELNALARRCETEKPTYVLEQAIARAMGRDDRLPPPAYTKLLDAAVALIPSGLYWTAGAGRLSPDEPLYGCAIYSAADGAEISHGETNETCALAICAAALRAISTEE